MSNDNIEGYLEDALHFLFWFLLTLIVISVVSMFFDSACKFFAAENSGRNISFFLF